MNFAQNIHPTRLFGTTCLKWHLRVAKSISLVSLSKDTEDKENSITVQLSISDGAFTNKWPK